MMAITYMNQPQKKFNLKQDANDLTLFMYTIQRGPVHVEMQEDFQAIIAYSEADAFNQVRTSYPAGIPLFIKKHATINVHNILSVVNKEDVFPSIIIKPSESDFLNDPPVRVDANVEKFLYSLALASDTYVTDKRDRATIKRIINKLKPHENIENLPAEKNPA